MWWNLAVNALPSVLSGIISTKYAKEARDYGKWPRPEYKIPSEATEALKGAKFQAGKYGLPGIGPLTAALGKQSAASYAGIRKSGMSAAEELAAMSAVDQATKDKLAELGVESARQKQRADESLQRMQMAYAPYQKEEQMINKFDPFRAAMSAAAEARRSAHQGWYSTVQTLANLSNAMATSMKSNPDWWGLGKKTEGGITTPTQPPTVTPPNFEMTGQAPSLSLPREMISPVLQSMYGDQIGDYDTYAYYGLPTMYNQMINRIWQEDIFGKYNNESR